MRPLRGGQGTFDRIIENIRRVAGRCRIAIGGNFDESSVDSYPALLRVPEGTGLRRQAGQGQLQADRPRPRRKRRQPEERHPADAGRARTRKPLNGTCMTSAGVGRRRRPATTAISSTTRCRSCARKRRRHGFPTHDGVHNGPCHVHMQHAHTIGPDGSLYRLPRVHRRARDVDRPHRRPATTRCANRARERFERLVPGRNAATAPSSRSVPGDAWRHRTRSLAT